MRGRTLLIAAAVLALLVALPWIGVPIPGLFERSLDAPGTLNVLALCFVFGTLALSYDLLFGYVVSSQIDHFNLRKIVLQALRKPLRYTPEVELMVKRYEEFKNRVIGGSGHR